jgi:hypothetical protein
MPAKNASAERTALAQQYAGLDIVHASNGTYSLSDRALQLVHDLSAASKCITGLCRRTAASDVCDEAWQ